MRRNNILRIALISVCILFIVAFFIVRFAPGRQIGYNFASFSVEMLGVLPCAFILIGLFAVWVKRETVEKYLGERSGIKGYIWGVLLAGITVGGLYVAFPVAYSLYSKGTKLSVIFTSISASAIGASAICRVPMTVFEASFLGIKFSAIRLLVSLPLIIVTSILLGDYLTKRSYKVMEGNNK